MKTKILQNFFLKEDGTFDLENALLFSGRIAGVCYDKEGFEHLEKEDISNTQKRINNTLENDHHSVYDHIMINFNIVGIPKILAMVLNNEHQYTTSEKSARYTDVTYKNGSILTEREVTLYNKWNERFKELIKENYPDFTNFKIKTLAQENARYLITVFVPTEMVYSTTLRQINYIASIMQKYIEEHNESNDYLEKNLSLCMQDFIKELDRLNVLDKRLMHNSKNRNISLFGKDLEKREEIFSHIYSVNYEASYASLAQAQRHRTLFYQMERMDEKKYFVPPILNKKEEYIKEWTQDIKSVSNVVPQGEIILINETGTYDNFILKTKERLCTAAQLEVMKATRDTLLKYKDALEKNDHYLKEDIKKYVKGARCTFGYNCTKKCNFKEGITLEREI
ncbi:MAG: FAD-dependent thymidylate synthase [Firmicutes bacterium]|nr:FAD-dependent thymidylate synthase [Bacillota bacterium]